MGLRYSATESGQLIRVLEANLKISKTQIDNLVSGTDTLQQALTDGSLKGRAYEAADSYFTTAIRPVLKKAQEAHDKLTKSLSDYKRADGKISHYGELDEAALYKERDCYNAQIASYQKTRDLLTSSVGIVAQLIDKNRVDTFVRQADREIHSRQDQIQEVDKKLSALREFNNATQSCFKDGSEDYQDVSTVSIDSSDIPKDYFKEYSSRILQGLSGSISRTVEKALAAGKHPGRVLGAKLQPRNTQGQFVKDPVKPRRWASGQLKGMSKKGGKILGSCCKWGGRAIGALNWLSDYNDRYQDTKDVGQSAAYATFTTAAAWAGGELAIATATAVTGTALSGILVPAAVAAGGALLAVGAAKWAYNNCKPVKQVVDGVGKAINQGLRNVGNAFKGLFGGKRKAA